MTDHFAIIDIEEGTFRGFRIECDAPADARCHAIYTCDCEAYYGFGVSAWDCLPGMPPPDELGQPWHETYEREVHYGRFDRSQCTLADWAEIGENLSGTVRFPVDHVWTGDEVVFKAVRP